MKLTLEIAASAAVVGSLSFYLYHMTQKYNLDRDSYSKFASRIETDEIALEEIDDQSFKLDGYLWTIVASNYQLTPEFIDKYSNKLDITLLAMYQNFNSSQIMELIKIHADDYEILDIINQYQLIKPHVQAQLDILISKHKPKTSTAYLNGIPEFLLAK